VALRMVRPSVTGASVAQGIGSIGHTLRGWNARSRSFSWGYERLWDGSAQTLPFVRKRWTHREELARLTLRCWAAASMCVARSTTPPARSAPLRPPVQPIPPRRDARRQRFVGPAGKRHGLVAGEDGAGGCQAGEEGGASEACLSPVPMSVWTKVRMRACQKSRGVRRGTAPCGRNRKGC